VQETLNSLDQTLRRSQSSRAQLLSVQVFLADLRQKPSFDRISDDWIGADPQGWPQRVCLQAGLANGLMIEIQAVAAR
jgi:enamine deaminase RidA (YjgF/YER057c/UK114 family)